MGVALVFRIMQVGFTARREVREDKKQSLTEHTGYTEKGEKVED